MEKTPIMHAVNVMDAADSIHTNACDALLEWSKPTPNHDERRRLLMELRNDLKDALSSCDTLSDQIESEASILL